MTTTEPERFRTIYVQRVNAVMDYIEANLGGRLTLRQLAEVAQFSPFHFHRIFLSTTGETLHGFINRVRLERAAAVLLQHPKTPITEIGSSCGFTSPSSFARSFKDHYAITPTRWRSRVHTPSGGPSVGRRPQSVANGVKVNKADEGWCIGGPDYLPGTVVLRQEPWRDVSYIRYVGPFQGSAEVFAELFHRLYAWATPLDLIHDSAEILVVYHDNPSLTDEDKLRVSACVGVPQGIRPSGEVGRMELAAGLYAIGSFTLTPIEYQDAWTMMWSGWLPESGYEPADGAVLERFVDPLAPEGPVDVELCIPVQPLRS